MHTTLTTLLSGRLRIGIATGLRGGEVQVGGGGLGEIAGDRDLISSDSRISAPPAILSTSDTKQRSTSVCTYVSPKVS